MPANDSSKAEVEFRATLDGGAVSGVWLTFTIQPADAGFRLSVDGAPTAANGAVSTALRSQTVGSCEVTAQALDGGVTARVAVQFLDGGAVTIRPSDGLVPFTPPPWADAVRVTAIGGGGAGPTGFACFCPTPGGNCGGHAHRVVAVLAADAGPYVLRAAGGGRAPGGGGGASAVFHGSAPVLVAGGGGGGARCTGVTFAGGNAGAPADAGSQFGCVAAAEGGTPGALTAAGATNCGLIFGFPGTRDGGGDPRVLCTGPSSVGDGGVGAIWGGAGINCLSGGFPLYAAGGGGGGWPGGGGGASSSDSYCSSGGGGASLIPAAGDGGVVLPFIEGGPGVGALGCFDDGNDGLVLIEPL